MTLKEIIQLAQTNIGEDTDDESVTEAKNERSIVTHINRAYLDIVTSDWRPFKSMSVARRRFRVRAFCHPRPARNQAGEVRR